MALNEADDPIREVERWVDGFEAALLDTDPSFLIQHFAQDAHWRDLVAFTWDLRQEHGAERIAGALAALASEAKPHAFRIADGYTAPRRVVHWGRDVIEAILEFRTALGRGLAVVRLLPDPGAPSGARAWLLLTTLHELDGAGSKYPDLRSERYGFVRSHVHENWADHRRRRQAFEDREPEVLVVGAGHSGLTIAARLEQMGTDALVVDRYPRVGDVWRTRYHSLALHNPTATSHFPYLPFPETFPRYLSKDKLANWLEFYADAMELNVWTATEFVGGHFDTDTGEWAATVRRTDGTERVLRPRHLVMAVGAFGNVPNVPDLPGLDSFAGEVVHTSRFRTGADYAGLRALVVGVGSSGHDTALELHEYGAQVTMLQRNPITVVDLGTREKFPWARYAPGASIEEVDLVGASNLVFPMAREALQANTILQTEHDADLLRRLDMAGMRTYHGEDGGGWQLQAWRTGSGYYINVGASEAIAEGKISVIQTAAMATFVDRGVQMQDDGLLEFDVVILATGFKNATADMARMFGPDVAERIGDIFTLDDHGTGEWSNTWAPTAQEHLWFIAGGLAQTRPYSRYLALQIKARLEGLVGRSPHLQTRERLGNCPAAC